jgi:hypothetical protein
MATIKGSLTLQYTDANGVNASYPYYFTVADTATAAQVITDMQQLMSAIGTGVGGGAPVADAGLLKGKVTLEIPLPVGVQILPGANTTLSKNLSLSFLDVTGELYTPLFPAPNGSDFLNGRVDLTNAAIVALGELLDGSTPPAHVVWTGEDFELLDSLKRGYKSIRKHRKSELRASLSQLISLN